MPPLRRSISWAVAGVICIRPRAPAFDVWSRKPRLGVDDRGDQRRVDLLVAACWRMMSSWRSGSVSSRTTLSTSPNMKSATAGRRAAAAATAAARPALRAGRLSSAPCASSLQLAEQQRTAPARRSSTLPSLPTTCPARAAFSSWAAGAPRARRPGHGRAPRRARGGPASEAIDRDRRVEDLLHAGLEQQRHLDHRDRGPRPAGRRSQPAIRSPTRGWSGFSSHASSPGSAKTISPTLSRSTRAVRRHLLAPALGQQAEHARSRAARGRRHRWRSSPRPAARMRRGPPTCRPRCRR